MYRSLVCCSVLLLASCGGAATETTTDTTTTETSAENTSGSEQWPAWADMDHEQRAQYMHDVVVPRMRTVFQEHDAERFASFGCATCHGANAREVDFHMPNTLHPLNPQEIPALFSSEDEATRSFAEFMAGPVEHTMAELLGEQPFDPATGEGFGCMNCHATAQ